MKKCPVILSTIFDVRSDLNDTEYNSPLTLKELYHLSLGSNNFHLMLSSLPDDVKNYFHENFYFTFNRDLTNQLDLSSGGFTDRSLHCHFESVDSNGQHSAISLCFPDRVSGILRVCGGLFYLSNESNNFFLHSQSDKFNCDICTRYHPRPKRTAKNLGIKSIPDYYANYLDGIKRYVELVLVADNSIYKKYDEDEKKVRDKLYSIANVVNSLYSPLNIRVTLTWADIWKDADLFEVTKQADKTLERFMNYRKSILQEHPNDNAHLITDVQFGTVIGKGYRGTICSYDYSGGVIVDHHEHSAFVGNTLAHEMGHNFGMDHDDQQESCKCPGGSCIMAASSNITSPTIYFSDCSLDYLDHAFKRGVDYCLRNVPETVFGGSKCGNGVLEPGEDCDCGNMNSCSNKCCIASECKLAPNATCADGDCCDTSLCKPKSLATACRIASDSCDLPEFCDGRNPNCPADFFVQNGHECPDDPLNFCYEGFCGSPGKQCRFLWGPQSENSVPECYELNKYGTMSGNCGHNQSTGAHSPCKARDVSCGRLQCQNAEKLVFGGPSTTISLQNYVHTRDGQQATCSVVQTTYIGDKRKPDPGMVQNGAKCSSFSSYSDGICVNAQCRNRTELLQTVTKCEPPDCNGKGVCNNVGNCHCIKGYGGIGCDIPGYGGSVNSGPAHDSVFNPGLLLLYLFILGFVIFVVAGYYLKTRHNLWLHKEIWRKLVDVLNLHSIKIPIRNAPPPPDGGAHGRLGQHPFESRRPSFNSAWNSNSPAFNYQQNGPTTATVNATRNNNILRVNAAKPLYYMTTINYPINTNVVAATSFVDETAGIQQNFSSLEPINANSANSVQIHQYPHYQKRSYDVPPSFEQSSKNSQPIQSSPFRQFDVKSKENVREAKSFDKNKLVDQISSSSDESLQRPSNSKASQNVPLLTRNINNITKKMDTPATSTSSGKAIKPKPPNKPPIVATLQKNLQKCPDENHTAEAVSKPLSVKNLAAKFDSGSFQK